VARPIGRQDEEHRGVAALEIGKAEIGAAEDGDHARAVEEMGMALRGRQHAGRLAIGFAEVAVCGAGDQAGRRPLTPACPSGAPRRLQGRA
jgi:hypothetical protein